jgi:uncharacterized protein YhfF
MGIPSQIQSFWKAFLVEAILDPETPVYDVFHFVDNKSDANKLADLVLGGEKIATASLLWEYELSGKRQPRPGDLSVVTNWEGSPLCVIETLEVEVRAFEDVDSDFAAAEGEGDLSLEYWKDTHWVYFGRVCIELGRKRSPKMPVVCERFRVVYVPSKN